MNGLAIVCLVCGFLLGAGSVAVILTAIAGGKARDATIPLERVVTQRTMTEDRPGHVVELVRLDCGHEIMLESFRRVTYPCDDCRRTPFEVAVSRVSSDATQAGPEPKQAVRE